MRTEKARSTLSARVRLLKETTRACDDMDDAVLTCCDLMTDDLFKSY